MNRNIPTRIVEKFPLQPVPAYRWDFKNPKIGTGPFVSDKPLDHQDLNPWVLGFEKQGFRDLDYSGSVHVHEDGREKVLGLEVFQVLGPPSSYSSIPIGPDGPEPIIWTASIEEGSILVQHPTDQGLDREIPLPEVDGKILSFSVGFFDMDNVQQRGQLWALVQYESDLDREETSVLYSWKDTDNTGWNSYELDRKFEGVVIFGSNAVMDWFGAIEYSGTRGYFYDQLSGNLCALSWSDLSVHEFGPVAYPLRVDRGLVEGDRFILEGRTLEENAPTVLISRPYEYVEDRPVYWNTEQTVYCGDGYEENSETESSLRHLSIVSQEDADEKAREAARSRLTCTPLPLPETLNAELTITEHYSDEFELVGFPQFIGTSVPRVFGKRRWEGILWLNRIWQRPVNFTTTRYPIPVRYKGSQTFEEFQNNDPGTARWDSFTHKYVKSRRQRTKEAYSFDPNEYTEGVFPSDPYFDLPDGNYSNVRESETSEGIKFVNDVEDKYSGVPDTESFPTLSVDIPVNGWRSGYSNYLETIASSPTTLKLVSNGKTNFNGGNGDWLVFEGGLEEILEDESTAEDWLDENGLSLPAEVEVFDMETMFEATAGTWSEHIEGQKFRGALSKWELSLTGLTEGHTYRVSWSEGIEDKEEVFFAESSSHVISRTCPYSSDPNYVTNWRVFRVLD